MGKRTNKNKARRQRLRRMNFKPKVGNTETVQKAWEERREIGALFNKLGIQMNSNRIREQVRQESESAKPRRLIGASLVAPPIDWASLARGGEASEAAESQPEEQVDPVERLKDVLGVPEEAEKQPPKIATDMCVTLRHLVAKYGADYGAMAKDRKLNPFQLTKGVLRKNLVIFFTQHATPEELDRAGLVLVDGEVVAKSLLR